MKRKYFKVNLSKGEDISVRNGDSCVEELGYKLTYQVSDGTSFSQSFTKAELQEIYDKIGDFICSYFNVSSDEI